MPWSRYVHTRSNTAPEPWPSRSPVNIRTRASVRVSLAGHMWTAEGRRSRKIGNTRFLILYAEAAGYGGDGDLRDGRPNAGHRRGGGGAGSVRPHGFQGPRAARAAAWIAPAQPDVA